MITDDREVAERVEFRQQIALGNILAPFDSYLSRGEHSKPERYRQRRISTKIPATTRGVSTSKRSTTQG